jgi:hypothetical protein
MDDKQIQAVRAMVRPIAQVVAGLEQGLHQSPAVASAVRGIKALRSSLPISRELALEYGLVEPTEAERAEMERLAAETERERAEHEAKMAAARAALAGIVEEPARTILDLHCEDEHGDCDGCEFGGWEAEPPVWPCTTTVTIARHYGIDIPEGT